MKIQVWDKVIEVRARTATAEEKKRVWPIMSKQWPDYDKYQAGTNATSPWCCSRRASGSMRSRSYSSYSLNSSFNPGEIAFACATALGCLCRGWRRRPRGSELQPTLA